MNIRGIISDIIFRNEENGYTVINFDADGDLIIAVGIFPFINIGDMYEIVGNYRLNSKFGEQFMIEKASFIKPNDLESIRKYLASGLFHGVGEKTAKVIVDFFGLETLDILENQPHRLTEVKGIGKKRAKDIIEAYKENIKARDAILFLQKYDISTTMAMKIYKEYSDATMEILSNNPYRLVEDIDGIGFLTADRFAEKLGIMRDSNFRLKAALFHILKDASNRKGHTYLPVDELISDASKLTSIYDKDRYLDILQKTESIKKTCILNEDVYSLNYIYYTENSIATRLINIKNLSSRLDLNVNKEIENYQQTNGIILDTHQKEAIKKALDEGVVIITGGPGTGKTTIIKCLVTIFSQRNLKVALAAPTGRAAKRMSQATGAEASTLHRLLGITSKNFESREITFLEYNAIIVDEISMVDIFIFNTLLKSMNVGSRLILVGDKDQLPSIACGNILSDVISSNIFCTVYLSEIYRQAKDSLIIVNAHRINNCQMPITKNANDFFIDNKKDILQIKESVVSMVAKRIPKYINVDSKDIQVLSPMRKGAVGVVALNKALQQYLNPNGKEIVYKDTVFRVGDKVMQTINNYSMEWIRLDNKEQGKGIFNGDIGYIMDIHNGTLLVEYEDKKQVVYQNKELDELAIAYCISVHKSQGCEFPVVIVAISGASYAILTKNLLYTAITRAKEMVVLVGDERNIEKMIKNKYMVERFSLLKYLLLKNNERFIALRGSQ